MKDFYELLGVSKTATEEEIKKGYRKAAQANHPDVNPDDPEAKKKFQEIQEAYETLSDPSKRARYNAYGATGSAPYARRNPRESSFEFHKSMFEEFFGGSSYKGRNLSVKLEIDFKEAFLGCEKQIVINKRKKCTGCQGKGFSSFKNCETCKGNGFKITSNGPFEVRSQCEVCSATGKVDVVKCLDCSGTGNLPGYFEQTLNVQIPSGIQNGMQVRLAGQGEESVNGGVSGDVIIFVTVKDHPLFFREGINLSLDVPVSYSQLVFGDEIEIPTLTGESLKVKVPAGSQSHTKLKIKGRGYNSGMGNFGDLIATLKLEIPKNIDDGYKEVVQNLAEIEKNVVTPRREQWLKKVQELNK